MSWKNKFIDYNTFSRPMTKLKAVRKIVIHYTANNGASAMNHFNYFKNLSGRYASAHLFTDRVEALCIIPLNEVAYHANDGTYKGIKELSPNANLYSIGVEMCMEKNGTIHPDTIARTEDVVAELCRQFKLDPIKDVVRHYDITRKNCPAPWVANGSLFTAFKNRVSVKMNKTVVPSKPKVSIGSVTITHPTLNIRNSASLNADVVGVAVKNSKFDVYEVKGNFLNIDTNKWISNTDGKYAKYTPKAIVKPVSKPVAPKPVEVKPVTPKPSEIIKEVIKKGVENNMKLDLTPYLRGQVAQIFRNAQKDGILSDSKWEEKALNDTLTMSEAIYICLVLDERRSKRA